MFIYYFKVIDFAHPTFYSLLSKESLFFFRHFYLGFNGFFLIVISALTFFYFKTRLSVKKGNEY